MKFIKKAKLTAFVLLATSIPVMAQSNILQGSQQFRLADRIIRIAEPGELVDSVNVWGDVGSSGRYLVPKGTTLPLLLSYSLGPRTLRDGQTNIDWSKMRVEINVQEYDPDGKKIDLIHFKYRFEDPFPDGMYTFKVENNHTVTVRVKRNPSFRDYLSLFASTVAAVASTIILIDRLRE